MNKSHVFFLIQKNTKLQDLKDFFDLNYDNNLDVFDLIKLINVIMP